MIHSICICLVCKSQLLPLQINKGFLRSYFIRSCRHVLNINGLTPEVPLSGSLSVNTADILPGWVGWHIYLRAVCACVGVYECVSVPRCLHLPIKQPCGLLYLFKQRSIFLPLLCRFYWKGLFISTPMREGQCNRNTVDTDSTSLFTATQWKSRSTKGTDTD